MVIRLDESICDARGDMTVMRPYGQKSLTICHAVAVCYVLTRRLKCCWIRSVIVHACFVGHIPICTAASDYICLVWNYDDILQVLHKHQCVLAYLAGHTHCSAYSRDENGLHHVVFPGVIEAAPDCPAAHATVLLYPNCVVIKAAEGSDMSNIVMNTGRHNGSPKSDRLTA